VNALLTIITSIALMFAPATPAHDAPVTAPTATITAPVTPLRYDAPTITTTPAPTPTTDDADTSTTDDMDDMDDMGTCEEDEECWTGSPNDSRVAPHDTITAPTPNMSPEDSAWLSFETSGLTGTKLDNMSLDYIDTITAPTAPTRLPATQFAVPDTETPNTWHIFGYVPTFTA
jgi:hypothetical protein